jgi:hypothetical protein
MAGPAERVAATSPVPPSPPRTPWRWPLVAVALGASAILLLVLPTHSLDSGFGGLFTSVTAGILAVVVGLTGLVRLERARRWDASATSSASRGIGVPALMCALGALAGAVPVLLLGGEVASNARVDRSISEQEVRAFGEAVEVPVYYLGTGHGGADLEDAFRPGDAHVRGLSSHVAAVFRYVDGCGLITPHLCAKELQIYVERGCSAESTSPRDTNELTIRGVPASLWGTPPSEAELTLWTGETAVRLRAIGYSAEELLDAAERLRGLNVDVPAGSDLPAPSC